MAEFLTTKDCTAKIQNMVRDAEEKLWLISPYIDIDDQLKQRLQAKDREGGIDMRLVYRGEKLRAGEREWLKSLDSLEIRHDQNLHAKCYMNESDALITSLNLYAYSEVNNIEWGILVSQADDKELYGAIHSEFVDFVWDGATPEKSAKRSQTTEKRTSSASTTRSKTAKRPRKRAAAAKRQESLPKKGVCIRKGESIAFDILKPYCGKCYKRWSRYKNREYQEDRCHACGRDFATNADRPLCFDCIQRYGGPLVAAGHGFEQPEKGACIRDGEIIAFDLSKPYCGKCFRNWNKYKNRDYEENRCHACGLYGPSSMERPVCLTCYLKVEHLAFFRQQWGSDYEPLWVAFIDEEEYLQRQTAMQAAAALDEDDEDDLSW